MEQPETTHIHFHERFSKPPKEIFAFLADHDNFVGMFAPPFLPTSMRRAGQSSDPDAPDGVGTVRRVGLTPVGPFFLNEEIVKYDPPHELSYKALDTMFRYHLGELEFIRTTYGTHLAYEIEFATVSKTLDRILAKLLPAGFRAGLKRHKEQLGWLGSDEL